MRMRLRIPDAAERTTVSGVLLHYRATLSLETLPAIDGPALTWFEWHLCRLTALIADHIEHRAIATATGSHAGVTVIVAFPAPLRPARWTPDGIHKPAFTEEALLSGGKYELRTAVATLDYSVFAVHLAPDSLAIGVPNATPRRDLDRRTGRSASFPVDRR